MCVGDVLRAFTREALPIKVCPGALPGISAFPASQGLLEAALWGWGLPWKMGLCVRLWSGVRCSWFCSGSLGASPAFGRKQVPGGPGERYGRASRFWFGKGIVEDPGISLPVLSCVWTPEQNAPGSPACAA